MASTIESTPVPIIARRYSRAELVSDAAVHLAALFLAMGAVPVLITMTAIWRGDAPGIAGVSIYGATLILMFSASLLYNHLPRPDWQHILRSFDQAGIFLKIAGTYTPFALLSGTGWGLLAVIWSVAGVATTTAFLFPRRPTYLVVLLCLTMGWAILFGGQDLVAVLPQSVLTLMIAGGVLYSVGTPFLLWSKMRFHNTIWHGFVAVASTAFFAAVILQAAHSA